MGEKINLNGDAALKSKNIYDAVLHDPEYLIEIATILKLDKKSYSIDKKAKTITVTVAVKGVPVGTYNAFEILMTFNRNNLEKTLNDIRKITCTDLPFVRVGIDYFKKIIEKDRYSIKRKSLKKWSSGAINHDFYKGATHNVPQYETFTIHPDNVNYKCDVDGLYNQYSEFSFKPASEDGNWETIDSIIKHIFREQYDLGITYMQVLYRQPKQVLPVLVLVSKERGTGKSTFGDLLDIMFGDNYTLLTPQNISSQFNDTYGIKNIIMIEESKFETKQVLDKIKAISTQKVMIINPKGLQPYKVPFFGKLIITSNDEHKFSIVDKEEIRYWVRKLPVIPKDQFKSEILKDIKKEIPYFLRHLLSLELPEIKTRMVFTPEEIYTDALGETKGESMSGLFHGLCEYFVDLFNNDMLPKELEFTPLDIKNKWYLNSSNIDAKYIRKVLKEEFELIPGENRKYYVLGDTSMSELKTGRAFTLSRKYLNDISTIGDVKEVAETEEVGAGVVADDDDDDKPDENHFLEVGNVKEDEYNELFEDPLDNL